MKILTNKFFILGNLLLLLIAIPVTLYFVKKQQELRSRAAPSSKLYIDPATTNTTTQCQSASVALTIDPGSNIVSIVDFYITYDPTKLDITQITPSTSFPTTVRASSISNGAANMSVSVGADVTRAVSSVVKVATITFVPKAQGSVQIQIDSSRSRVFSLEPTEPNSNTIHEPSENVLSSVAPGAITIGNSVCLSGGGSITPTPSGTQSVLSPTPTINIIPTASANQAPICTSLTASPAATGTAPFSVLFTGQGNDPDTVGLITKATFTFGDGQTQDVTTGLNQKTVSTQASHTYQNPGIFPAALTFTDNTGALSQACTQNITATTAGSGSATITPTSVPTIAPTLAPTSTPIPTSVLVEKPTAAPTIAPTGSIGQTLGIIGAVVASVVVGLFLLAL